MRRRRSAISVWGRGEVTETLGRPIWMGGGAWNDSAARYDSAVSAPAMPAARPRTTGTIVMRTSSAYDGCFLENIGSDPTGRGENEGEQAAAVQDVLADELRGDAVG